MVARPFPADPVLTALALGYRNDSTTLIADTVLPKVPVPGPKFSWTRYPIAQPFTVPRTLVGRRGRPERVEFSGERDASEVNDHALEFSVPQTDIDEAKVMRDHGLGSFNPVDYSTMAITDLLLLDREVRVAAMVQNPNNYASDKRIVLSGHDQFDDPASDPIEVIKAGFNATLIYRPNTMTMSRPVWSAMSSHPKLVNAIRGNVTGSGIIRPDEFVSLFAGEGLKTLAIGESFVNTARPGQNAQLSRVWGNSIALMHINPMANPTTGGVTFGFTAEYGSRFAMSWPDRDVGAQGGTVVRVGERLREMVVAPDVGFLIQNPISGMPAATIVPAGH